MKAPITQAQAWAVIAESSGWNDKELPVLPEPDENGLHSNHALQAYGDQRAAHAREMALEEARLLADSTAGLNAQWLTDQIEALKGK